MLRRTNRSACFQTQTNRTPWRLPGCLRCPTAEASFTGVVNKSEAEVRAAADGQSGSFLEECQAGAFLWRMIRQEDAAFKIKDFSLPWIRRSPDRSWRDTCYYYWLFKQEALIIFRQSLFFGLTVHLFVDPQLLTMADGGTAAVTPSVAVKVFSAGTAGCVADLVTFPLDTAKVRLQVRMIRPGWNQGCKLNHRSDPVVRVTILFDQLIEP